MDEAAPILVVGPGDFRRDVARIVPSQRLAAIGRPLEAVWKAGHEPFGAALVALHSHPRTLRVVQSLRKLQPSLRIVVSCAPAEEPLARRALARGADEYVLRPLARQDLLAALGTDGAEGEAAAAAEARPPRAEVSAAELERVREIVTHLGEGVTGVLERFAALLTGAFAAKGVSIRLYEHMARRGQAEPVMLRAGIEHQGESVGMVELGPPTEGSYSEDAAQRLRHYAQLVEATAQQARERAIWQDLAWTDDLSGLRNRRYFEQALEELLENAANHRGRLTVLLFDIDDFKSYNDRFGHETGDKLIQEISALLRRCTREQDVVARLGGDEFAVVLWDAEQPRVPGSTHPDDPMQIAKRFCREIATHDFRCLGADAPGPVTISGGLACYPWHGNARDELLVAADRALLDAKRTGKNRVHLAGEHAP